MSEPEFITVDEVAERWHLRPRAVRDEIGRKRLRATKIGGQWLIRLEDVVARERAGMNVRPTIKRTRVPQKRAS